MTLCSVNLRKIILVFFFVIDCMKPTRIKIVLFDNDLNNINLKRLFLTY